MHEDYCGHAQPLGDYGEMRSRLTNILDRLMPGEEHAILLTEEKEGGDSNDLKDTLINWMNENRNEEGKLIPSQKVVLNMALGSLGVGVEHMVDDYWWVEVYPVQESEDGRVEVVTRGNFDIAVLRILHSGENLPLGYEYGHSAKFKK